jgi:ankyrin repeat protein
VLCAYVVATECNKCNFIHIFIFLELLLSQCVDLSKSDRLKNTALHYACLNRSEETALMLLERITEPEWIDSTNSELKT